MVLTEQEAETVIEQCLAAYHTHDPHFERLMDQAATQLTTKQWERLEELLEPFSVVRALEIVANGHAIATLLTARKVCEAFDVPFNEKLILSWGSRDEAFQRYGFIATTDGPWTGVDCLSLSYDIAEQLGLGQPGYKFSGKGFQAQENSRAIARKLSENGKL